MRPSRTMPTARPGRRYLAITSSKIRSSAARFAASCCLPGGDVLAQPGSPIATAITQNSLSTRVLSRSEIQVEGQQCVARSLIAGAKPILLVAILDRDGQRDQILIDLGDALLVEKIVNR